MVSSVHASEVEKIVEQINKRNKRGRTIHWDDVAITVSDRFIGRFRANLDYEKPDKFRLIVRSLLGTEMDIGSNEQLLWFWSKRMRPSALYYCSHGDLYKSHLKTPFNPLWMMSSLGLNEIDLNGASFGYDQKNIQIRKKDKGPTGQEVTLITVIDPSYPAIVGQYIIEDNRMVASTEIKKWLSFGGGLSSGEHLFLYPAKIVTCWHEEDVTLEWNPGPCHINSEIDKNTWQMPEKHPKIDMSID